MPRKSLQFITPLFFIMLFAACQDQAQDSTASTPALVITNARIIVGNGQVIESGNLLIRNGRLESVSSTPPSDTDLMTFDAGGMTAMPGFIDGHRHIISGDTEQWFMEQARDRLQEYLDAGFTTLMSGAGPVPGIVQLKNRIEAGDLVGPRIVTSGIIDIEGYSGPESIRDQVQAMADAGVEIIKTVLLEPEDQDILRMIVVEARSHGLEVMTHAVTVATTIAAVEAGAAKLVHTPTRSLIEESDGARIVADAGVELTSTLGIWVPIYGDNNEALWRDGTPFPDEAIARAGVGPVNGRHLWNAGVTYAFGTDTSFLPRDSLAHELIPLKVMFSPQDIVQIMGPNSAQYVYMSEEAGTLEPGKLADIVLIDGDPLADVDDLLKVQVVFKDGEIVADHR